MHKNDNSILKNFFIPKPLCKWLKDESKRKKTSQQAVVINALVAWKTVNGGYKP